QLGAEARLQQRQYLEVGGRVGQFDLDARQSALCFAAGHRRPPRATRIAAARSGGCGTPFDCKRGWAGVTGVMPRAARTASCSDGAGGTSSPAVLLSRPAKSADGCLAPPLQRATICAAT